MKFITYVRGMYSDFLVSVRYALHLPYKLHIERIQTPPKPRQTFIFIHGIGNTLHSWDEVYARMPDDVRVIGVDLLGFGASPKPYKAVYSARLQARSVLRTVLTTPMAHRPIIVGHSLGALVAVEMARRYPFLFQRIVLCSPPLYAPETGRETSRFSRDALLRQLYRTVRRYPGQLERLSPLAVRVGLANHSLSITDDTVGAYIASLESSIINQSALHDIPKLKMPVEIIYGSLDPLVVGAHIQEVAKKAPTVSVHKVVAGHEVVGRFARSVAALLQRL